VKNSFCTHGRIKRLIVTLEELTDLENAWIGKLPKGSPEDERDDGQETGVYAAWGKIFELYVIEARKGEMEALKRALFLYWYSCSEPNELSGIPVLDKTLVKETLQIVNDTARRGELDTEFEWMLPYYYDTTDWYIDQFRGLRRLKKVSKANRAIYMPNWDQPACYESLSEPKEASARKVDLDPWEELCLRSSFSDRGQMGHYWKSIQDNIGRQ
jgi:hypothetical protein